MTNKMSKVFYIIASSFIGAVSLPVLAYAGDLRVDVSGVKKSTGTVRVALYDSASSFDEPAAPPYKGKFTDAQEGSVNVVFADIAPGTYGIKILHDVNGNEKMDMNFLGIPKEPFGFSNNAPVRFGPPKFSEASFEMGDEDKTIAIELR